MKFTHQVSKTLSRVWGIVDVQSPEFCEIKPFISGYFVCEKIYEDDNINCCSGIGVNYQICSACMFETDTIMDYSILLVVGMHLNQSTENCMHYVDIRRSSIKT
jgi:hypothetical protein